MKTKGVTRDCLNGWSPGMFVIEAAAVKEVIRVGNIEQ